MPNVAAVLKEEIARVARKEIKSAIGPLRKANTQYRRDIAELKRQIDGLQRENRQLKKAASEIESVKVKSIAAEPSGHRFSRKGLKSDRKRLGLSAADYGALIGVTGQSVYNWESGTARPRPAQLAKIVAMRSIGKREAYRRLDELE